MLPAKASIRKERERETAFLSIGIWRHLKSGKIINGIITGFPTIHVQSAIINMFMENHGIRYIFKEVHYTAKQSSKVTYLTGKIIWMMVQGVHEILFFF